MARTPSVGRTDPQITTSLVLSLGGFGSHKGGKGNGEDLGDEHLEDG